MSHENQTIRHQFLALACEYLFGQSTRCENFRQFGIEAMNLKPIPVNSPAPYRSA